MSKRIEALATAYADKTLATVAEIAEETAYGRRDAMREALAALNLALSVEQPGAAVAAVALRSKLNGLLVERKEIGGPGAFAEIPDDELRARLLARVERLGLPSPPVREIIEATAVEVEPAPVESKPDPSG